MKKYFVFAAAVIALAACSSEEENVQTWNGEIRLSAVNVVQTRAAQGIQSTAFDNGEKVDVFINENATTPSIEYLQPLVYTSGTGGVLTTSDEQYYPQSNGVNIFAVYPSGVAGTNVNATNVAFAVESDQSEEDAYKASDLMVGAPANNPVSKTSGTVQLTFKHCLSKININISAGDGITETDLQGATVTILNTTTGGTFNVQTGVVTANGAQAAATPITAGTLEVREDTGVQGISAIIVPQTVSAGRQFISIRYGGDQQTPATELFYTLPQAASVDFAAGYSYTFNITAKKSGLTLDGSTITDWTDNPNVFSGEATPTP
jgi:hypothetical protein